MRNYSLSKKDLILLKNLEGSCKVNYKQLADILHISHTAVKKRVRKLISRRYLAIIPALNLKKLGFIYALLFLEVANDQYLSSLLKKFSQCPRIIFMFRTLGEYNLVALIYAENDKVLDSILGSCMLRTMEGIRKSTVIPISSILLNHFCYLKIPVRKSKIASCGIDCYSCMRYKLDKCIGCPSVIYYRGYFSVSKE